jgi:hypothetical protein
MLKKKIWANFQRILELFTQKIVTKLSKIWVRDPRSEIRGKPIPHPGFGSATLVVRYLHVRLEVYLRCCLCRLKLPVYSCKLHVRVLYVRVVLC